MLTKKDVLLSIKDMPASFWVEGLVDRIILLQQIETGLEQSAKKQVNTTTEARKKLKKWLK